jgi:hypothetical protein
MSFKRRIVRRQVQGVVAPELVAGQPSPANPQLSAAGSLAWEVAAPRATRYAPVRADRGRVIAQRTPGNASGHR